MKLQLVRHATLRIQVGNVRLLVDPMLSDAGTMDAVPNTPNQRPNPLVPLTVHAKELLEVDAVLLTHSHRDHLDDTAVTLLPKNLPILCQPADEQKLKTMGFTDVLPIDRERRWNEITINRTGGQHGTGEIGRQMGPVSGYVLTHAGEPSLYIAGDTIWCQEVEEALKQYQPAVTVLFSGAAQFNAGDPITMAPGDIAQVAEKAPDTNIVVAHMETWNHCLLTRDDLRTFLTKNKLDKQVHIPEDGEWMDYV